LPSFDHSSKNGFRCVKYIDKGKIPEATFQKVEYIRSRDYSMEKPVSEDIFKIYKNQFMYDNKPLDAIIETRDEGPADWITEKITFSAAYGDGRMISYLFLPKNISPPFQTIIYFPGSNALTEKDLLNSTAIIWIVDYIIKSGRAVMCPVK
jgi:eukaryotic-like serine/threonine-protein kinase